MVVTNMFYHSIFLGLLDIARRTYTEIVDDISSKLLVQSTLDIKVGV